MASYWDKFTGDQLLDIDLEIDDLDGLENLVHEVPDNHLEAHVASRYDLSKSGRDKVRCVHGHDHHRGFVMKVGDVQFLVGRNCAASVYGCDWDAHKNDFDAAVNRKRARQRRGEIEAALHPLIAWIEAVEASRVFEHYASVRARLEERMPWIMENGRLVPAIGYIQTGAPWPSTFFSPSTDPESRFAKIAREARVLIAQLAKQEAVGGETISRVKLSTEGMFDRLRAVIADLDELVTFFQPAVLETMSEFANRRDNPGRRSYEAGLLSITCRKVGGPTSKVEVPAKYLVPDRARLEAICDEVRKL